MSNESPADLTDAAIALSLQMGAKGYEHKLPTARRMQARGLSDTEIEELLVIKLRPEHRAPKS